MNYSEFVKGNSNFNNELSTGIFGDQPSGSLPNSFTKNIYNNNQDSAIIPEIQ